MKLIRRRLAVLAATFLCVFAVWGSPGLAQQARDFLSEIPDLPLMEGLRELQGRGFAFDKPSGRIVEAFASGDVEESEVRRFYERTLGQLGWTRLEPDRFARETETLSISYERRDGTLLVGFSLHPE